MAVETDVVARTARSTRWGRVPGWLGAAAALLGLATYALPWYSAAGGATYTGLGLLLHDFIAYDIPAYSSPYDGPSQVCAGALSGLSLPVALMAGLFAVALAVSLALAWRPLRRGVAFALASALLIATWLGILTLFPLLSSTLRTDFPQGNALGPSCPPIGARGPGFYALLPCLILLAVACLWRMALALPSAPWLLGMCAALGLLGFAAPWDLSFTPGLWLFAADATCAAASFGAQGGYLQACNSGAVRPMSQVELLAFLPAYAVQFLLLLLVLVIAILAARRRAPGWLRALQIVALAVGVLGLVSGGLIEGLISLLLLAPGASLVLLAFLLLAIFAGRAGEESQAARHHDAASPQPVATIPTAAARSADG